MTNTIYILSFERKECQLNFKDLPLKVGELKYKHYFPQLRGHVGFYSDM